MQQQVRSQWITPITLKGEHVTLLPLSEAHCDDLIESTKDGELWKLWYAAVPSPENMVCEIRKRLNMQQQGLMLPFAVIHNATEKAIGITTYCGINANFRRTEIGWTWYRKSMQRTPVNTECKLLMLTHAFETLSCIAVELKTSTFNLNSRNAIERLGAKLDGIARNYRLLPNGLPCDGYIFSIIDSEWKIVKTNLKHKLMMV